MPSTRLPTIKLTPPNASCNRQIRLLKLMNEVLELAQIEAGKVSVNVESLNPAPPPAAAAEA